MSFSKIIQNAVDDTVTKYVEKVALKFNIDKQQLLNIWNSIDNLENKEEKKQPYDDSKQKIVNSLSRLTKPELVELCKTKNLKAKGTKAELIEILSDEETKKITVKSSENINSKLVAKVPSIAIKRNKFNNFEHEETSFIFDNKEKKVYGKQNADGSVSPLTKDDINLCNKYKFSYVIPDNLDTKNNKNDDELEELDEDVNIENDDENLEEEEEDDDLEEIEEEEEEFEEEYDE